MNNLENSQAPYNFGVCASADCTKRFTCLRYIALQHASPQYPFLPAGPATQVHLRLVPGSWSR